MYKGSSIKESTKAVKLEKPEGKNRSAINSLLHLQRTWIGWWSRICTKQSDKGLVHIHSYIHTTYIRVWRYTRVGGWFGF